MLYIGCDHAGFKEKQNVIQHLKNNNIKFVDVGTFSEQSVHYPDVAKKVCEQIKTNKDMGILICGTGLGMCMCANKFKHIRAGLCTTIKQATFAKRHNNANVLCLQGRDANTSRNLKIVNTFLNTNFDGGRHLERIKMYSDVL